MLKVFYFKSNKNYYKSGIDYRNAGLDTSFIRESFYKKEM